MTEQEVGKIEVKKESIDRLLILQREYYKTGNRELVPLISDNIWELARECAIGYVTLWDLTSAAVSCGLSNLKIYMILSLFDIEVVDN